MMIPISAGMYFLLPKILLKTFSPRNVLQYDDAAKNNVLEFFKTVPIPHKIKDYFVLRLHESGIGNQDTWIYWILITLLFPFLLFAILSVENNSLGIKCSLTALCFVLPNIYLGGQIKKRKKVFIINAYKLYYFLHSQISSGIKVTDAIKGLYVIADHPLIQKTFISFVAQYELTLNIEKSLQYLRKSFTGYDCEMLCVSIQQCVNTGMAGKTLLKMEQMMFAKYFYYLQKDTENFKTKLCPVLFDALNAFNKIMVTS
ncbi:MAG: hypothetical protein ACYC25_16445 [Paludibacter sp.]